MAVKKRGDTWYYDFKAYGTRYRAAVPLATTKRQAERAEAEVKAAVFEGRYVKSVGSEKLADFAVGSFLEWSRANKRSWLSDKYHVEVIKTYFGNKSFGEIGPMHVEKFKQDRLGVSSRNGGRAPASVNRELACLSKVFSLAIEHGKASANPCLRVKKLREDNARSRFITPDEEKWLLASCVGDREHLRHLITAALHTGMRRGELFNLQWTEVDLVRGYVHVRQTKSGRDRHVPINSTMQDLFATLQRRSRSAYVFPSPRTGKKLVEIKRAFTEACSDAGITDLHFHDLRHTFATRLADSGADAFALAELLGHADLRMTRRYTHATDQRKRQLIERVATYQERVVELERKKG